jgi:hypothetical protein
MVRWILTNASKYHNLHTGSAHRTVILNTHLVASMGHCLPLGHGEQVVALVAAL